MKNVASHWTLAAVAFATIACLMLFAVVLVQPLEATQQTTSEEEVAAKVRAELEARLAEIKQRLHDQLAELEELGELDLQKLQQALEEVNVEGAEMRALMESQVRAARLQNTEEALRRAQEVRVRALASAERAAQEAARYQVIGIGRGSCDVYGESVLDYTEDLELTDDQSEQIRGAQRETRRAGIARRADIEVAEMDLESLYEADQPDLTAIRAQLEELAALDVDNQMAGLSLRQQVRQILTPAQLETLDDMRNDDDKRSFVIYSGGNSRRLRVGGFDCWR